MLNPRDLTLQFPDKDGRRAEPRVLVVGEVLWDLFPDSQCLGGAPLNFAVHSCRLGLIPVLVSAVGRDALGEKTVQEISSLGLDVSTLQRSSRWNTGTASVRIDAGGQPDFRVARPAAYDDVTIGAAELQVLEALDPSWFYYGTLFSSTNEGRTTVQRLLAALPKATRFYDVNLRPGFDSPELISWLLGAADIVKMNESEAQIVAGSGGLPLELEPFCRTASARFGWRAVCVTLGERGCALLKGADFVRGDGEKIKVADTVGAGDAFAAAFLHGLAMDWPAEQIARFANRVGALIASRTGAIPEWNILEAATA